eukprot:jgi/Botrbrau1/14602/Bobra.67_2s0002.1
MLGCRQIGTMEHAASSTANTSAQATSSMISGSGMIPSSSAGADQEPESTESDMDADNFSVELREILASTEEDGSALPYSDEPISFMELLLGNLDGSDMQNIH